MKGSHSAAVRARLSSEEAIVAARTPPIDRRIPELDSLRGIAALTVVFHHCLVVFPAFWALYTAVRLPHNIFLAALGFSPLHLAWGGGEAVDVFFVLSGLVLSFPFLQPKAPGYKSFVLKRTIRIYLPYFAVMTAALLLMRPLLTLGHPQASSWMQQYWNANPNQRTRIDCLLMLGDPRYNTVNPVIWSLVHELRISLIFPLLMWLARKRSPTVLLASMFLFSAGAKLGLHVAGAQHWWSTIVETCQYVFFFVAGVEIALHRDSLCALYRETTKILKAAMFTVSLLLLNARWELPPALRELSALCTWAGAIWIVALVLASSGPGSFLRRRPLLWLGEVSYSLYLTHCLVLFAALFLLDRTLPLALIVAFVPVVALFVAAGVYRIVEMPALSLSRNLFRSPPERRTLASNSNLNGDLNHI
jgi:peptidoglycan/LPS O-acetylase OafA/YrhL